MQIQKPKLYQTIHKKVDVGTDGNTPRKQLSYRASDPILALKQGEAWKKKTVNVGTDGETPTKQYEYNVNDPSINVSLKTFSSDSNSNENTNDNQNNKSIEIDAIVDKNRPKTSRGKAHPSPDEFFDYIIPSPDVKKKQPKVIIFPNKSQKKNNNANILANKNKVDNQFSLHSDEDDSTPLDDVRLLGCWLFGSALRV
eukprot:gene5112-7123_t